MVQKVVYRLGSSVKNRVRWAEARDNTSEIKYNFFFKCGRKS